MNYRFDREHGLNGEDVRIANNLIGRIERLRASENEPHIGDLVQGAYMNGMREYNYGRIEKIGGDEICVCAAADVNVFERGNSFGVSISGGPFEYYKKKDFQLIGDELATFWEFGHAGACAGGAIRFCATVHRWFIPYTWQSSTFVNEYKQEREEGKYRVTINLTDAMGFISFGFVSMEQCKRFLDYVGVTIKDWDECDYVKRYQLSHNTKEMSFQKLSDLPSDVKPIKGYSNGYLVDCYIRANGHNIEMYRPRPCDKETYKPYPIEERWKMEEEVGNVGF